MSAARLYAEQAAITTTLMRELLPPQLHNVHGVEFAGRYRPRRARPNGSAATSTTSTPAPPRARSPWWSSGTSAARAWKPPY